RDARAELAGSLTSHATLTSRSDQARCWPCARFATRGPSSRARSPATLPSPLAPIRYPVLRSARWLRDARAEPRARSRLEPPALLHPVPVIVVQKYGGSSVADVARLERVAEKVVETRRGGADVVVVVSAMGKTTNELLALAHQVDASPPRRELDMLLTTGERVSMALLSMAIQKRGEDAISFTGSQSGIITNDRHFDARIIEVRPFRIEDELARG